MGRPKKGKGEADWERRKGRNNPPSKKQGAKRKVWGGGESDGADNPSPRFQTKKKEVLGSPNKRKRNKKTLIEGGKRTGQENQTSYYKRTKHYQFWGLRGDESHCKIRSTY